MAYSIEAEHVRLEDIRRRIEETDLIPSLLPLLNDIETQFEALEQQGITTLAGLRDALKNPKRLETLSQSTGIDAQYLTLLRREIGGYFRDPLPLSAFDWLPEAEIARLAGKGINDTARLYQAASDATSAAELAGSTGVELATLKALIRLTDLSRVQWVSPKFARVLFETGYDSSSKVAHADAESLYEAILRANTNDRYFKGKIGLRDIKRLIKAASYVQDDITS